jgi:Mn-dependent DtxR family transcriptional regulator
MDGYNAIVCSNKVIQDALSISRPTVTRAIKILKDYNFIKIAKTGTANVYYINSELVWKSWGTNHRYAEFGAKIIIAESEQEQDAADTTTHRVPTATIKPRRKRKGDNSDKHTESAQIASTVG